MAQMREEEVAANVLRAGKEISAPLQQHFQSPGRGAEMREGLSESESSILTRGHRRLLPSTSTWCGPEWLLSSGQPMKPHNSSDSDEESSPLPSS